MSLELKWNKTWKQSVDDASGHRRGGLAQWLLSRMRRAQRPKASLELVERISIAPRQTLALVEAEGRRILIATSADGAAAFFPLDTPTASRLGRTRASW